MPHLALSRSNNASLCAWCHEVPIGQADCNKCLCHSPPGRNFHRNDIAAFEQESDSGMDPDIKKFATRAYTSGRSAHRSAPASLPHEFHSVCGNLSGGT